VFVIHDDDIHICFVIVVKVLLMFFLYCTFVNDVVLNDDVFPNAIFFKKKEKKNLPVVCRFVVVKVGTLQFPSHLLMVYCGYVFSYRRSSVYSFMAMT
jgi:hypothetical protein